MDLKRIIRHLSMGSFHIRRRFPTDAMDRITTAISKAELGHRGEIRFAVEASLDLTYLLKAVSARERAVAVFSDLRVWDTEANNGVLIYLMLADRDVEILADRGIHAKVGPKGWEDICKQMEAKFRAGDFEAGVIHGIESVGQYLRQHFPDLGPDANELSDRPVVL